MEIKVETQRYIFRHAFPDNGGGVRLKVGFQPLEIILPTARWIHRCMQVRGVLLS